MNKLEELSPKDETMDYSNLSYDELFQMFKERKIKYYGKSIEKQELIHLITEFDKDLPILDYPKMNCKQLKQICFKFMASSLDALVKNLERDKKIEQKKVS